MISPTEQLLLPRTAVNESAGAAQALADVSRKLSGTESFLKLQNDAVRIQASAEADALKSRVKYLQERIDHLLLDNDQYRRALASSQAEAAALKAARLNG